METIKRQGFVATDLSWMKNIPQAQEPFTVVHPMVVPPVVILPMEQHLGTPAKPIVEVDDYVLKGQLVAKATGLVSANIHAPTSGTVVAIAQRSIHFDEAKRGTCVVIETDGRDEWVDREPCRDFQQVSSTELLAKIRAAGIVDMDGEGLPAHICLNPKKTINTIIISACHWNNAVNADDVALIKYAREIVLGLKIIRQLLDQPKRTVIAIERGKEEVVNAIFTAIEHEKLINCDVEMYDESIAGPDRQQLIETITERKMSDDGLPLSVGAVCLNACTVYSIYRAVCLGEPSITQLITANGNGFNRRQTLLVPLGTPMSFILKQQGYDDDGHYSVRINSIQTGSLLTHQESPINKLVNSLWSVRAFKDAEAKEHRALSYLDDLSFSDEQRVANEKMIDDIVRRADIPANEELEIDMVDDLSDDLLAETDKTQLNKSNALNVDQEDLNESESPAIDDDLGPKSDQYQAEAPLISERDYDIEVDEFEQNIDIEDDREDITNIYPRVRPQSLGIPDSEFEASEDLAKTELIADAYKKPSTPSMTNSDNNLPDNNLPDNNLPDNAADLTIRSQNILRLQTKLKDTEEKLEQIDPNDEESAEAFLLSINVLIEKIKSAKSLREKEVKHEVDPEANNRTLLSYMGSLQERLSLAQGVLSKTSRANASTQSAIKQALIQLESRLEHALGSIQKDIDTESDVD